MSPASPLPAVPVPASAVSVVGIGADGWAGLPETARAALLDAEVLIGAERQLALLPPECGGARVPWPSPLRPAVRGLIAAHAGSRTAVLASGDPMFYGIGRALTEELGADALRVLPHPSSVSYACARLGWPVEDTETVTLVGRPTARLAGALHDGRRLLVLSADATTPAAVAALLRDRGFGPSRMRVLEQLGSAAEDCLDGTADTWEHPPGDPLNVIAVDCRSTPARCGSERCPVCPTRRTSTTASSPSAMSAQPRWVCSHPPPESSCGTSAAVPVRSRRSGCGPIPPAGPSPWNAIRNGRGASSATRTGSVSPGCAWSPAVHRTPWPDCRCRTPCSSEEG